ncbi:MAG: hypothetical protein D6830_03435 [Ignavibacteria bacterium]|nr:MAG: hypothetical protein D6830_03435 [Ignavibacteria bacterium]
MAKVLFTTKYTIDESKVNEYLNLIEELKLHFAQKENVKLEVFKIKSKANTYQENYEYADESVWESADEEYDERYEALMSKLSDMIIPKSTEISTMVEL